jgi:hypothetical protein
MLRTAERVLKNAKHPAWLGAWKFLAEHGYGKPTQPLSNADGSNLPPAVIAVRLVKTEVQEPLPTNGNNNRLRTPVR